MTVKQLIDVLSQHPNDAIVVMQDNTEHTPLLEVADVRFAWVKQDDPRLRRWSTRPMKVNDTVKTGVVIS